MLKQTKKFLIDNRQTGIVMYFYYGTMINLNAGTTSATNVSYVIVILIFGFQSYCAYS